MRDDGLGRLDLPQHTMPLSQRLGDALSIFLPANSVYLDLDNPPDDPRDEVVAGPPPHPTTTAATHTHLDASTAGDDPRPTDDDPFAPSSPSVLSHASSRSRSRPRAAPPAPHPSSPRDPHVATTPQAGEQFATEDDARDPFYDEPVPTSPAPSHSRSPSPTPTSSVVIHPTPRPERHSGPVGARSPPSSFASSSSKGRMGASRSAIGTRSLMGLMGGTRYEGQGFPFGGVGVGEEDEDEDDEPDADLVRAEQPRARSRCVPRLSG